MKIHLPIPPRLNWVNLSELILVGVIVLTLFLEIPLAIPPTPAAPLLSPKITTLWANVTISEQIADFNNTQGMAVDQAGNIYIANPGSRRLQKFLADGTIPADAASWSGDLAGQHPFVNPSGVSVTLRGGIENVWVLDGGNGWIYRLDPDGKMDAVVDASRLGVYNPRGLAFAPSGDIFITDTGMGRILHLDPQGKMVAQWGSVGKRSDQFTDPAGIVFEDQALFIVDSHNNRIVQYSLDGKMLNSWKIDDESSWIASDGAGKLWVASVQKKRISIFDTQGNLLSMLNLGTEIPLIDRINGIAAGPDGKVVIAGSGQLIQVKIDW